MATRSLPGVFCAGSGHQDEENEGDEDQGAAAKPPADRKHGELPLFCTQELQETQIFEINTLKCFKYKEYVTKVYVKPEGKGILKIPVCKYEDNIKISIK